ncbi:hypothetical protein [Georgenia satyanarayanai]|uniref:hypothetical protein n=1 Tax=Georgenia satyanarayanai TaxID=860221 RepID=UPI002041D88B|nr:hypothetical protein [Georgenia satyanarayanai]
MEGRPEDEAGEELTRLADAALERSGPHPEATAAETTARHQHILDVAWDEGDDGS